MTEHIKGLLDKLYDLRSNFTSNIKIGGCNGVIKEDRGLLAIQTSFLGNI